MAHDGSDEEENLMMLLPPGDGPLHFTLAMSLVNYWRVSVDYIAAVILLEEFPWKKKWKGVNKT